MKALVWIAKGLAAVVALVVLVWGISRALPVPAEHRQARALLEADPGFIGRNGFAALWFLSYEGIPEDRYTELLARDIAAQQEIVARRVAAQQAGQETDLPVPPPSVAAGLWPRVDTRARPVCGLAELDCLEKVRTAPQDYAKALEAQQGLLARIAALGDYDYVQSPLPQDVSTPIPELQVLTRAYTAHALAHVEGRSDEALDGLCHSVATGRMLMARSDSLVLAMMGSRLVHASSRLFSQVLSELPADHPLPAGCRDAFALPAPAGLSTCNAMRGEFRMVTSIWPTWRREDKRGVWLLLDEDKSIGRQAWVLAPACTERAGAALAQDAPPPPAPQINASPWTLRCAANTVGCILTSIAGPAYAEYPARLQDAGAQLRLVSILLWLRGQPGEGDVAARLAGLPGPLRSPSRAVSVSADGRWLEMPAYSSREAMKPQVALPLQPSDAAAGAR